MKVFFVGLLSFLLAGFAAEAQKSYASSIQEFQKAYPYFLSMD